MGLSLNTTYLCEIGVGCGTQLDAASSGFCATRARCCKLSCVAKRGIVLIQGISLVSTQRIGLLLCSQSTTRSCTLRSDLGEREKKKKTKSPGTITYGA